jgi:hypothetical protein
MEEGERILARLKDAGLADPAADYETVIADLGKGTPPMLALAGPDRPAFGSWVITKDQRTLLDQLVAIARAPYRTPAPAPPITPWKRIADDLQRTAGRTLEGTFRWEAFKDHSFWVFDFSLDGEPRGGCGVFTGDGQPEDALADLADKLCEGWLHEEVWGGWPMCPRHPDRPMWAGVSEAGRAVWRCEADTADEIEIGRLGLD